MNTNDEPVGELTCLCHFDPEGHLEDLPALYIDDAKNLWIGTRRHGQRVLRRSDLLTACDFLAEEWERADARGEIVQVGEMSRLFNLLVNRLREANIGSTDEPGQVSLPAPAAQPIAHLSAVNDSPPAGGILTP